MTIFIKSGAENVSITNQGVNYSQQINKNIQDHQHRDISDDIKLNNEKLVNQKILEQKLLNQKILRFL